MVVNMNMHTLINPENPDPETDYARKALLWGRDNLLAQAVDLLLKSSENWDVVRVSSDEGVEKLLRKTKSINPDVVVLCREKSDDDLDLPLRLIQAQHCLRVVVVGLESNLMQVYSKHDVVVSGVSDLLSVVDAGYFFDHAV